MGSGKSAVLVEANINLATDFPGCRLLIGRKDFKDLHDTTMKLFDEVCPQALLGGPNGKPGRNDQWNWRRIRLPKWPADLFSEILFRPLSDVNDFGSAEFMAASFDESHEVPESSAQYVLTRLRQQLPTVVKRRLEATCLTCSAKAGYSVQYHTDEALEKHSLLRDADGIPHKMSGSTKYLFMATANPFPGFFKQWFVDGLLDSEAMEAVGGGGVHFIRALPRDNPHLPPTYESEMRALYGNTTFVKRMMDGDWGAFEGQIYSNFEPRIHEWRMGDPEPGQYRRVIGGLDFGGERLDSHFSTAVVAVVTNTNRVILVDEFKGRGPDIAAKQMMWMLAQQKRWCNMYTNSKIEWRADRSQMVGIQMWRNMGMHITYSKGGPDSVVEGIKHVQSMLEKDAAGYPGLLYLPHMREFRQEMIEYHWDEDKLKPVKKNDDIVDATRYLAELVDKFGGDPNVLLRNHLGVVV
jgi:hypothetical protein